MQALAAPHENIGFATKRIISRHDPKKSLVSVVIPTRHRPNLLRRALTSVFNQTYKEIEVIVVVDGPDDDTAAFLSSMEMPNLDVIFNTCSQTAAGARNIGADKAAGEWLAFLDDDDEWLPRKIERQVEFADRHHNALVTCLSRVVTPDGTFIQPLNIYDNSAPLDEYLFDRCSPFVGTGFIQTSSWLMRRSLFNRVRFRTDTPHDDWDFILRASKIARTRIETVPEVLVVLYVDEPRPSLSTTGTCAASLAWIDSIRPIITRRAYGGFCLGVAGPRAAKERTIAGCFLLLHRAYKYGAPRPWRVATFLGLFLLPTYAWRRLRPLLRKMIRDGRRTPATARR